MIFDLAFVITLLSEPVIDPEVENEQNCLIENAIYEARGEGEKGMRLVTEVVLNRTQNQYRGNTTYCETVYDKYQFSWTNGLNQDEYKEPNYSQKEYAIAARAVLGLLYGYHKRLLPKNTMHYLNPKIASDLSWYDESKVVYRYKNHVFLSGML